MLRFGLPGFGSNPLVLGFWVSAPTLSFAESGIGLSLQLLPGLGFPACLLGLGYFRMNNALLLGFGFSHSSTAFSVSLDLNLSVPAPPARPTLNRGPGSDPIRLSQFPEAHDPKLLLLLLPLDLV